MSAVTKVNTGIQPPSTKKPINSKHFSDKLSEVLTELNAEFYVSEKMGNAFIDYCNIFNTVVTENQLNHKPRRHIMSPATGSAKTTAAKLYASQLASKKNIPGLIVVRKAMDAADIADHINKLAKKDIARCYYTISEDNPDTAQRVPADELSDHLVIVITHRMFYELNKENHYRISDKIINRFKLYKSKPREFIVIDERIDLTSSYSFSTEEVEELIGKLESLKFSFIKELNIDKPYFIDMLIIINDIIFKKKPSTVKSSFTHSHPDINEMIKKENIIQNLLWLRNEISNDSIVLPTQSSIRKMKHKEKEKTEYKVAITDLLSRIIATINNPFMCEKSGKYHIVSTTKDLSLMFGSVVILDATANVNFVYDAYKNFQPESTIIYEKPEIRTYRNAALHIATHKSLSQSKTKLRTQFNDEKKVMVKWYLATLNTEVGENDKMLLCVHKEFLTIFKELNQNKNITIINWGNHAGTNIYSHYNKVAAIGWLRLPGYVNANKLNAAAISFGNYKTSFGSYDKDVHYLSNTGIIDDFVQLFNRTRSRVSIDEDGNCKPVDFYLFSGITASDDEIVQGIINEFKSINAEEWIPAISVPIKRKKSKAEERAENIIALLVHLSETYDDIPAKTVRKKAALDMKTFSLITRSPIFKKLLESKGIKQRKSGRDIWFDFLELKKSENNE